MRGVWERFIWKRYAAGQPVAVKLLRSEKVAGQSEMVARFALEAQALRALNHPNIVKVLATVGEDGHTIYRYGICERRFSA